MQTQQFNPLTLDEIRKELKKLNGFLSKGTRSATKDIDLAYNSFNFAVGHLNKIVLLIKKEIVQTEKGTEANSNSSENEDKQSEEPKGKK